METFLYLIISFFLQFVQSLHFSNSLVLMNVSSEGFTISWNKSKKEPRLFIANISPLNSEENIESQKNTTNLFVEWMGLVAGKTYTAEVSSIGYDGRISHSSFINVTTTPFPPYDVRASEFVNPILNEYETGANQTLFAAVYGAVVWWNGPEVGRFDGFHVRVSPADGQIRLPIQLQGGFPVEKALEKRRIIWGLTPGIYYAFSVQTTSNERSSEVAQVGERIPPEIPCPIKVLSISPTSVALSWDHRSHRGIIDGYILEIEPAGSREITPNDQEEKGRKIVDLIPGTLYSVDVYSTSFGVISVQSRSTIIRTPPLPPVTPINTSKITPTSINITWQKPNGNVDYYEVVYSSTNRDQNRLRHRTYVPSVELTKLTENTEYSLILYSVSNGIHSRGLRAKVHTGLSPTKTPDSTTEWREIYEQTVQDNMDRNSILQKLLLIKEPDVTETTKKKTTDAFEETLDSTERLFSGNDPDTTKTWLSSTQQSTPNAETLLVQTVNTSLPSNNQNRYITNGSPIDSRSSTEINKDYQSTSTQKVASLFFETKHTIAGEYTTTDSSDRTYSTKNIGTDNNTTTMNTAKTVFINSSTQNNKTTKSNILNTSKNIKEIKSDKTRPHFKTTAQSQLNQATKTYPILSSLTPSYENVFEELNTTNLSFIKLSNTTNEDFTSTLGNTFKNHSNSRTKEKNQNLLTTNSVQITITTSPSRPFLSQSTNENFETETTQLLNQNTVNTDITSLHTKPYEITEIQPTKTFFEKTTPQAISGTDHSSVYNNNYNKISTKSFAETFSTTVSSTLSKVSSKLQTTKNLTFYPAIADNIKSITSSNQALSVSNSAYTEKWQDTSTNKINTPTYQSAKTSDNLFQFEPTKPTTSFSSQNYPINTNPNLGVTNSTTRITSSPRHENWKLNTNSIKINIPETQSNEVLTEILAATLSTATTDETKDKAFTEPLNPDYIDQEHVTFNYKNDVTSTVNHQEVDKLTFPTNPSMDKTTVLADNKKNFQITEIQKTTELLSNTTLEQSTVSFPHRNITEQMFSSTKTNIKFEPTPQPNELRNLNMNSRAHTTSFQPKVFEPTPAYDSVIKKTTKQYNNKLHTTNANLQKTKPYYIKPELKPSTIYENTTFTSASITKQHFPIMSSTVKPNTSSFTRANNIVLEIETGLKNSTDNIQSQTTSFLESEELIDSTTLDLKIDETSLETTHQIIPFNATFKPQYSIPLLTTEALRKQNNSIFHYTTLSNALSATSNTPLQTAAIKISTPNPFNFPGPLITSFTSQKGTTSAFSPNPTMFTESKLATEPETFNYLNLNEISTELFNPNDIPLDTTSISSTTSYYSNMESSGTTATDKTMVFTKKGKEKIITIKNGLTTICKPNNMTFLIDKKVIGEYEKQYGPLHLNKKENNKCAGVEHATYYRYTIAPNILDCGTRIELNETHVNFTNFISNTPNRSEWVRTLSNYNKKGNSSGNLFTTKFIHVRAWCSFPLDLNVTSLFPFLPQLTLQVVNFEVSGIGKFSAVMQLYKSIAYNEVYLSPPTIELEEELYVGITLLEVQDNYTFAVVKKCWGTPFRSPDGAKSYPLIENGCPSKKILNGTVRVFENGQSRRASWGGNAFKFVEFEEVWLHCQVRVCFGTTCKQTCGNGRKRRSNHMMMKKSSYHVISTGPIGLKNRKSFTTSQPTSNGASVSSGSFSKESALLVLIVVLCAIVAMSCVIISCVVVRLLRRQNCQKSSDSTTLRRDFSTTPSLENPQPNALFGGNFQFFRSPSKTAPNLEEPKNVQNDIGHPINEIVTSSNPPSPVFYRSSDSRENNDSPHQEVIFYQTSQYGETGDFPNAKMNIEKKLSAFLPIDDSKETAASHSDSSG